MVEADDSSLLPRTSSSDSTSSTTSSSTSSSSSNLSSPENTLHRACHPLREVGGDAVDGSPPAPPGQPTTIGRFQVTTNSETTVGRFSVSRAAVEPVTPTHGDAETQEPPQQSSQVMGNGPALSPEGKSQMGMNNSFNSYFSSDNDSEFEDEDFKQEISKLREKYVSLSVLI